MGIVHKDGDWGDWVGTRYESDSAELDTPSPLVALDTLLPPIEQADVPSPLIMQPDAPSPPIAQPEVPSPPIAEPDVPSPPIAQPDVPSLPSLPHLHTVASLEQDHAVERSESLLKKLAATSFKVRFSSAQLEQDQRTIVLNLPPDRSHAGVLHVRYLLDLLVSWTGGDGYTVTWCSMATLEDTTQAVEGRVHESQPIQGATHRPAGYSLAICERGLIIPRCP